MLTYTFIEIFRSRDAKLLKPSFATRYIFTAKLNNEKMVPTFPRAIVRFILRKSVAI